MKLIIKIIFSGCLVALASCGTTQPISSQADQGAVSESERPSAENKRPDQTATAGRSALKLLETARLQAEAGQGELAAATLERAIKIEPDNPWLWHRLAVLRMQQRKWAQAIELANRSIALANGNQRLIGGNWLVISLALEGAGNKEAAIKAKKNSDVYLGKE